MVNNLIRNIKGHLQDAKGDIELESRDPGTQLRGVIDKTKGKVNKAMSRSYTRSRDFDKRGV